MLNGQRVGRWAALTAMAVTVGFTARFWWGFLAPLPRLEFTIDWSPLVYGVAGLLRAVCSLCVLGYLGTIECVVWMITS